MIKEIAEEFEKQNRINVLRLLEKIKDLEYEDKSYTYKSLEHVNKEERKKIIISFGMNNRIDEINIYDTSIGWSGYNMVHITAGLNTKDVMKISEELHTKYFGGK